MHSQGEEERVLLERARMLKGPRAVLDIGAHDGVLYSNSRALIESGWSAMLVEPSPFAFAQLLRVYYGSPRVTLINAAVGVEPGLCSFFDCEGGLYGTTKAGQAEEWRARGVNYREYFVPLVTVPMIASQLGGAFDVISVDTEGNSFDILKTVPLDAWAPNALVVEHDDRVVEIAEWARAAYDVGYLDAQNLVLLRKP